MIDPIPDAPPHAWVAIVVTVLAVRLVLLDEILMLARRAARRRGPRRGVA